MTKGIRRDEIKTTHPGLHWEPTEVLTLNLSRKEREILDDIVRTLEERNGGEVLDSYKGIDPGSCDERLYEAARTCHLLPESERDYTKRVEAYNDYLETQSTEGALISAVRSGQIDAMNYLIDHGANSNARDGEAFILAVERDREEAARTLLAHGADPNARDGQPLRMAAENLSVDMTRTLLEHGAEATPESIDIAKKAKPEGMLLDPWEIERLLNGGDELPESIEFAERRHEVVELIRSHYEQDLLRRHMPQASQSEGLSQTPQPSRRQRL